VARSVRDLFKMYPVNFLEGLGKITHKLVTIPGLLDEIRTRTSRIRSRRESYPIATFLLKLRILLKVSEFIQKNSRSKGYSEVKLVSKEAPLSPWLVGIKTVFDTEILQSSWTQHSVSKENFCPHFLFPGLYSVWDLWNVYAEDQLLVCAENLHSWWKYALECLLLLNVVRRFTGISFASHQYNTNQ
jgi:hypothetical protein